MNNKRRKQKPKAKVEAVKPTSNKVKNYIIENGRLVFIEADALKRIISR